MQKNSRRRYVNVILRDMREITKRIRRKLDKKEAASMFFKDKEQDGTLTNRQKNVSNKKYS